MYQTFIDVAQQQYANELMQKDQSLYIVSWHRLQHFHCNIRMFHFFIASTILLNYMIQLIASGILL